MKKMIIFIMLLSISIFSAACGSVSEELELAVCGSYAAPGMLCSDLKGNSHRCQIIEKDSQGRILYRYTTQNIITGKEETAYIICQNTENDTVYFYEDICYLFEPTTQENIENLKEANDWNQELNNSKMSARPINISFDLVFTMDHTLDYRSIKEKYCQTNNIEQSQIQEMVLLDVDPNGQVLYYLTLENHAGIENYFLICDTSYHISTYQASGTLEDLEQLSIFKSNHNRNTGAGLNEG